MLSNLIFCRIETRVRGKISDTWSRTILDLNPRRRQGFAEGCFSELCRRGHGYPRSLGGNAEGQAAGKPDKSDTIPICPEIPRPHKQSAASGHADVTILSIL